VTLSSCSSAAATAAQTLRLLGIKPPQAGEAKEEDLRPLPALAARLVGELGCAVLAIRYPVQDEFAVKLGVELYDLLLRQRQPLTRALQLALPRAAREQPANLAFEHAELMTEGNNLGAEPDVRVAADDKDLEQETDDGVREGARHDPGASQSLAAERVPSVARREPTRLR
jgi:hypothetical protein